MDICFFCTSWGQKAGNWAAFFKKVKTAGYDGVETGIPPIAEAEEFREGLNKYKLKFIAQHWETNSADFDAHKTEYTERIKALAQLKPLFINSHTGKDYFTFEQNTALIQAASQISAESGIPIFHETHRGRFAFAAHITKSYLEHSSPQLTLDVSHWCSVAESLLQDQADAVELAIGHTRHIHARVGYEQGAQVPNFILPLYSDSLQFHLKCWDEVVSNNRNKGHQMLSFTPEFGPPPYMIDAGGDAAERQWSLNESMMLLLKKRYS